MNTSAENTNSYLQAMLGVRVALGSSYVPTTDQRENHSRNKKKDRFKLEKEAHFLLLSIVVLCGCYSTSYTSVRSIYRIYSLASPGQHVAI